MIIFLFYELPYTSKQDVIGSENSLPSGIGIHCDETALQGKQHCNGNCIWYISTVALIEVLTVSVPLDL